MLEASSIVLRRYGTMGIKYLKQELENYFQNLIIYGGDLNACY